MTATPTRISLFTEDDGTALEVDWPLSNKADLQAMKKDLNIPDWVDMNYVPMQRAVVALWAARNAPRLHELFPSVYREPLTDEPVNLALFGGGAIKVRCRSTNGQGAPFFRELHDLDFIVAKSQVKYATRLLLKLDQAFGAQFIHFATRLDKTFNGLRVNKRFRYHVVDDITDNRPMIGVLDFFVDRIEMRHKIDCRKDLTVTNEHHTISLNNLLLSKCQYILEAQDDVVAQLEEHGQNFRILAYPSYRRGFIIVGMELKDLTDVSALIYDHDFGTGPENIDLSLLADQLRRDDKMRLTVRLNLDNLKNRTDILRKRGVPDKVVQAIDQKLATLLEAIPVVDKKYSKPWWEEAIDTPIAF